jgi:hypothetical protein
LTGDVFVSWPADARKMPATEHLPGGECV